LLIILVIFGDVSLIPNERGSRILLNERKYTYTNLKFLKVKF